MNAFKPSIRSGGSRHRALLLIAAAGLTLSTTCFAGEPITSDEFRPTRLSGYVYHNLATGERVRSRVDGPRLSTLFWENTDYAGSCNFYVGIDYPGRDESQFGRVKFGASLVHWGDVAGDLSCAAGTVDGFDVVYGTDVGDDPKGLGIPGYNLRLSIFDDYDGVLEPSGPDANLRLSVLIESIPGGDATLGTVFSAGWLYTVDLEGSGLEFDFEGEDLDGDGRRDFGYAYSFEQNQTGPKGICGPLLAKPASMGGFGTAYGCPDLCDWFNDATGEMTSYVGPLWFGGGDCSIPRPFASLALNLYGPRTTDACTRIDYNCDGLIDFSDFLEFLNRFDAGDISADITEDGLLDFTDYLEFLNLYDACA